MKTFTASDALGISYDFDIDGDAPDEVEQKNIDRFIQEKNLELGIEPPAGPGVVTDLTNAVVRGANNAQIGQTMTGVNLGTSTPEEAGPSIAEDMQDIVDAPASEGVTKDMQEAMESKGFIDGFKAWITKPRALAVLAAESFGAMWPVAGGAVAGGAAGAIAGPIGVGAGARIGGGAAAAANAFGLEYENALLESMQEQGLDPTNPTDITKILNDKESREAIYKKGNLRGAPIALLDGISVGIAGKIATAARGASASAGRQVAAGAADVGVQGVLGGSGEYLAQVNAGEEVNWAEIWPEALLEFGPGSVETAVGIQLDKKPPEGLTQEASDDLMSYIQSETAQSKQGALNEEEFAKAAKEKTLALPSPESTTIDSVTGVDGRFRSRPEGVPEGTAIPEVEAERLTALAPEEPIEVRTGSNGFFISGKEQTYAGPFASSELANESLIRYSELVEKKNENEDAAFKDKVLEAAKITKKKASEQYQSAIKEFNSNLISTEVPFSSLSKPVQQSLKTRRRSLNDTAQLNYNAQRSQGRKPDKPKKLRLNGPVTREELSGIALPSNVISQEIARVYPETAGTGAIVNPAETQASPEAPSPQTAQTILPKPSNVMVNANPDKKPAVKLDPKVDTIRTAIDKVRKNAGLYSPTEDFKAATEPLMVSMKTGLAKMGLKDVDVSFVNKINDSQAKGVYQAEKNLIILALGAQGPDVSFTDMAKRLGQTLNHESIHALKEMGVLKDSEWKSLATHASTAKFIDANGKKRKFTYLDVARTLYPDLSPQAIEEESIAEAFRGWSLKPSSVPRKTKGLFKRIVDFFKAMGGAFKKQNIENPEDIFTNIADGSIAERSPSENISSPTEDEKESRSFSPIWGSNPIQAIQKIPTLDGQESHGKKKISDKFLPIFLMRGYDHRNTDKGFGLEHIKKTGHADFIYENSEYTNVQDILKDFAIEIKRIDQGANSDMDTDISGNRLSFVWQPPRATRPIKLVLAAAPAEAGISDVPFLTTQTMYMPATKTLAGEDSTKRAKDTRDRLNGKLMASFNLTEDEASRRLDRVMSEPFGSTKPWSQFGAELIGKKPTESLSNALIRNFVRSSNQVYVHESNNGTNPIPDAGTSVGKSLEMNHAMTGRMEGMIEFGPMIRNEDGTYAFGDEIGGLEEIHEAITPDTMKKYHHYALARRELSLRQVNRQGFLDMDEAELTDYIGYAAEHPEFVETFDKYQAFNDKIIQFSIDTGLINNEFAEKLRTVEYLPFYRVMESEFIEDPANTFGSDTVGVFNNPRAFHQKLGGGTRALDEYMTNVTKNVYQIVSASMRNEAMNRMGTYIDDLVASGDMSLGKEIHPKEVGDHNRDHVVTFRREGQKTTYEIYDPAYYSAVASMAPQQITALGKVSRALTGVFRAGITLFPGFMLRNLYRGKISAFVTTDTPLEPFIKTMDGFKKAYNNESSALAIKAMTGFGGYAYGMSEKNYQKVLQRKQRLAAGEGGPVQRMSDQFMRAINWLERVGEASEMAERVALYEHLIDRGDVSESEAAFQAMNLINFHRKGGGQGVFPKMVIAMMPHIPFLNARIQGIYRMFENQKAERSINLGFAKVPAQVLMRGSVISAFSTAAWMMASDDDRWDDETMERKVGYDIFYIGDKTFYVPRAFEVGAMFGAFPTLMADLIATQQGDKFAKGMSMIFLNTFAFNPMPQAAKPLAESYMNYDFFKQKAIENQTLQNLLPSQRYTQYTSNTSRFMIDFLGDDFSDFLGLSPVKLDHLMRGYLGSSAMFGLTMTDAVASAVGAPHGKPANAFGDPYSPAGLAFDLMGGNSVMRDDSNRSSQFIGDVYELRRQATQAWSSVQDAVLRQDRDRANEITKNKKPLLRVRNLLNSSTRQMAKLNKRIIRVISDDTMTANEKHGKVLELKKRRAIIAKRVATATEKLGL